MWCRSCLNMVILFLRTKLRHRRKSRGLIEKRNTCACSGCLTGKAAVQPSPDRDPSGCLVRRIVQCIQRSDSCASGPLRATASVARSFSFLQNEHRLGRSKAVSRRCAARRPKRGQRHDPPQRSHPWAAGHCARKADRRTAFRAAADRLPADPGRRRIAAARRRRGVSHAVADPLARGQPARPRRPGLGRRRGPRPSCRPTSARSGRSTMA